MKTIKNKIFAIAISIFFILSMTGSLTLIPSASAHTPPIKVPTYAFINAAPNPVGVGQQVTLTFWIDKVPVGAEGPYGDRWRDMTVTVTKPDGTTTTLGPYTSDSTGGASAYYTPTATGTYKLLFNFPGQVAQDLNPYPENLSIGILTLQLDYVNDTFLPSNATTTFTVQSTPITYPPANPLPPAYWTTPINSMNREWAIISGNWLGLGTTGQFVDTGSYDSNGNFDPYSQAPAAAHVMWTKPLAFGGQIGGAFGDSDTAIYATGTAYEGKFAPVIVNGVLYYQDYPGAKNNPGNLTAVDLQTGQTLWSENTGQYTLKCAMVYDFADGDQYGAHAYLFTGLSTLNGFVLPTAPNQWQMLDAMTGQWILNIANANAGTLVAGPNGETLSYTVGYTANGPMLTMWNASLCIQKASQANNIYFTYSAAQIWRPPQGATIDWSLGNNWSAQLAQTVSGVPITDPQSLTGIDNGIALVTAQPLSTEFGQGLAQGASNYRIDAGYNATTGQLLWGPYNRTMTPYTTEDIKLGDGKYFELTTETGLWKGYDLSTGKLLWASSFSETENSSWNYFQIGQGVIGYGNLYSWGLSGDVYCYNDTTGQLEWTWSAGSAGYDTPYGSFPLGTFNGNNILADGKLYIAAGHDYTPPVFQGAELYCLNATTGKEIFETLDYAVTGTAGLDDGYMVWDNGYDNQIYCYGTGPTRTTVTAPDVGVTTATPITITGTVTDISAGSQQNAVAMNFPNGLPAVSDASMSQFMEAVYQQQPMPNNITGVPVTIMVTDSNHNTRAIGTTTSNANGFYSLTWTPDIAGNFTVNAVFAGTSGYYGSSANAAFYASPATTTAPTATPLTGLASNTTVEYGIAAIAIIIIVIGAVLAMLVTRKHP
ncbi:MAG: PQQ-binding-like beta-propeller repeat protein [Candidatus Bathyarchaeia archaeon]